MALPATLYDFQVELSHVDRAFEQKLALKVARHPSETLERVWLRVLAYCWCWDERLAFGPSLSEPDAPDILSTDYTGEVTQWIRVGKLDAEKAQKVLDRNAKAKVALFFDGPQHLAEFVEAAREAKLTRAERLQLVAVDPPLLRALALEDGRRAKLSLTIVGDHLYAERDGKPVDGPLTLASLGF